MDEHPKWPTEGEHLWSRWMAFDKKHDYRVCMHPDCHEHQKREVVG